MGGRFEHMEIVRVTPILGNPKFLHELEGTILAGGSERSPDGRIYYTVFIHKLRECYVLDEKLLERTGRMDSESQHYDGSSLKVIVDPKTGEGEPSDPKPTGDAQ